MPRAKNRVVIGFDVNPKMKKEFQKAFEPFDLNISEAMREALRRIIDMSEGEKVHFAAEAKVHDTRDILIERGLWDQIKSIKR
jgi:hypothetical protein